LEAFDHILPDEYSYDLPDHRIAEFPAACRDESKLLILQKDGTIRQDVFRSIAGYLVEGSHVVMNNSRVIPARLVFTQETGARIEFFCLRPAEPSDYSRSLAADQVCSWECMIGNSRRFKSNTLYNQFVVKGIVVGLKAEKISQNSGTAIIRFSWEPSGFSFGDLLSEIGQTPLPPYIKREPTVTDRIRYQTVYSKSEGSVAAPTAGLHFTPEVFDQMSRKNIRFHELTLHVGAGTFQPIKSARIKDHDMHAEVFNASVELIGKLAALQAPVVCVGTTSVRALESLYWLGVKLLVSGYIRPGELHVGQWEAYHLPQHYRYQESFKALLAWAREVGIRELLTSTRLMIVPGYDFRVTDTLITNFHQPRSTLLLLVAAFAGESWKAVYQYALQHNFRFLSYGDSSLLFRQT
jgi:S-adenosylmethionine:tRNA ribosyltransferase-isomerase